MADAALSPGMFFGTVLRTVDVSGLKLAEVQYHSGLRTPKHRHERALLVIGLQGHSSQVYGDEPSTCGPWTVAFHPAGEIHWDHFFAPGVRDLNIEFDPACLTIVRGYCNLMDRAFASSGSEFRWLAAKIYREFSLPDELSPLAIEALVTELLVEISRDHLHGAATAPNWLKEAREIVRARFTERLSLAELSSSVGVHPVHLAREFHRFFRRTIGQEIRYLRIELACRKLETRNYALKDVALMVGFSDQSHFGRTFKIVTGMTPVQFRAQSCAHSSLKR